MRDSDDIGERLRRQKAEQAKVGVSFWPNSGRHTSCRLCSIRLIELPNEPDVWLCTGC